MLAVSLRKHKTKEAVLEEIEQGKELMARVAKLRLQYFGQVVRRSTEELALEVLEVFKKSYRGAQMNQWIDQRMDRAQLHPVQTFSDDRKPWRRFGHEP